MRYALRHKQSRRYYLRNNSRIFLEDNFFTTTDNPAFASMFDNISSLEAHIEARLQFAAINLYDEKTVSKFLKKLLKTSEEFEVVGFENYSYLIDSDRKLINYNFPAQFKEIILFQIINYNYDYKFADYFLRVRNSNQPKRFLISTYGLTKEDIINLLGDSIEFDSKNLVTSKNLLFSTNKKTDINLLKLCFENNEIKMLDTKKLNSLSRQL